VIVDGHQRYVLMSADEYVAIEQSRKADSETTAERMFKMLRAAPTPHP
jgi:hypothetical protein